VSDGGKIWTDAAPLAGFAKGPSTRACMRKLNSGAFLLVHHDAPPAKSGSFGRSRLTAWLSTDEGRTWRHKLLIDERAGVSYSDAIQGPDGQIVITNDLGRYGAGDKAILCAALREEDLRGGRFLSDDAHSHLLVNHAATAAEITPNSGTKRRLRQSFRRWISSTFIDSSASPTWPDAGHWPTLRTGELERAGFTKGIESTLTHRHCANSGDAMRRL